MRIASWKSESEARNPKHIQNPNVQRTIGEPNADTNQIRISDGLGFSDLELFRISGFEFGFDYGIIPLHQLPATVTKQSIKIASARLCQ